MTRSNPLHGESIVPTSKFQYESDLDPDCVIYSLKMYLRHKAEDIQKLVYSVKNAPFCRFIGNIDEKEGMWGVVYDPKDGTFSTTNRMCFIVNEFAGVNSIYPISEQQEKWLIRDKRFKTFVLDQKVDIEHDIEDAQHFEFMQYRLKIDHVNFNNDNE